MFLHRVFKDLEPFDVYISKKRRIDPVYKRNRAWKSSNKGPQPYLESLDQPRDKNLVKAPNSYHVWSNTKSTTKILVLSTVHG